MNVLQTLQDNAPGNALSLAANVFSGPVQDAINLYLNGATFSLGDAVTFTIAPKAGQVTIQANPVTITGTANSATVTVTGSGQFDGATITATFTDNGDKGVSVDVAIESGPTVSWTMSTLWPSMLDSTIFNDLSIADVDLDLKTTFVNGNADIDFQGSASLDYQGQAAATGLLKILRASDDGGSPQTSFLAGIVVPSWSPGSIWSPLSPLTFVNSGAVFSSISTADVELSALIDPTKVPAIQDPSFKIQQGVSFFTTLQLTTGSVAILQPFLPSTLGLSLYANLSTDGTTKTVIASMLGFVKGSFTFNGVQLEWDMKGEDQTISLSTGGTFQVDSDQQLTLTGSATIDTTGNATIKLAIQDWEHPFDYPNLIVQDFEVDVILGTDGGVTLELGGSFEFGNPTVGQFTCTVGGAITDFEDPSGIVFDLKDSTPGKPLTLGLLIDEITTVDIQSIPVIDIIDQVFQFEDLGFWVVEVPEITVNGKTYYQGFGIAADFTIYGEEVTLNVDVEEKTGGTPSFSGEGKLSKPLVFGSVLALSAATDTTIGPDISVSSTGSPYYLYVDAQVVFLDVIKAALTGQATKDGFQFVYTVQAGQQGNQGAWLNEQISVLLSTSQQIFAASFAFSFGFKSVTLGPLSILGVQIIPATTLDLSVGATLSLGVNVPQKQITLAGSLNFTFMSLTWNPSFSVTLDLNVIIQSLEDVGKQIVAWMEHEVEQVFSTLINDLDTFLSFLGKNIEIFLDQVIGIAKILDKQFHQAIEDIVKILYKLGYAVSDIVKAIMSEFDKGYDEAVKLVEDIIDGGGCPATTAGNLLGGTVAVQLIPHLKLTGRSLMGPALFDLMGSAAGQSLLQHYYGNRSEIDTLLQTNRAVQQTIHRVVREVIAERRRKPNRPVPNMAGYVEPVLESLREYGSDTLKRQTSAVLAGLPPFEGLTYEEFLRALQGEVAASR